MRRLEAARYRKGWATEMGWTIGIVMAVVACATFWGFLWWRDRDGEDVFDLDDYIGAGELDEDTKSIDRDDGDRK